MTPAALHHVRIAAEGAVPTGWLLLVHGMLGSGGNFRSFARKLVERRPDRGVVLADLRLHGGSRAAPPPHTVAAAAGDVRALAESLIAAGTPVRALAGHSLGGKVVLAVRATRPAWLEHTFVLDAAPGPRPELLAETRLDSVGGVLRLLAGMPARHEKRDAFVTELVRRGLDRVTALWLALNLDPAPEGGFVWPLDLAAMQALLADYAAVDLWSAITAPAPGQVHVVLGGRSRTMDDAARARLAATPGIDVHLLPEAGHWVHVDALDALVDIVARAL